MTEVVQLAGTCLRVVMAVLFLLTPGIVFWLLMLGLAAMIRHLGPAAYARLPGASCS